MKALIELVLERKKITQQDLAETLNVSVATIKRLKGTLPSGVVSETLKEKIRTKLEAMVDKPIETEEQYHVSNERKIYRLQEKNRLLNKENRNLKKDEFHIMDTYESILDAIEKFERKPFAVTPRPVAGGNSLIIQLSDLHLGSIVNLKGNKFNLDIAQQRLENYCATAIDIIMNTDVSEIIILNTGDNYSLDFRPDQLLSLEHTRAENFVKGYDILCNFFDAIIDLGIVTRVISVLSNESRLKGYDRPSTLDGEAIDSFDYMLHAMLKRTFSKCTHVYFENDCSSLFHMFEVKGHNFYALHGHTVKKHDKAYFDTIKLNNLHEYGYVADMVILGHLHQTSINPTWCRSSSLKGNNEYSNNHLTLEYCKPSQNMYLVNSQRIIPMPITLD